MVNFDENIEDGFQNLWILEEGMELKNFSDQNYGPNLLYMVTQVTLLGAWYIPSQCKHST